MQPTLITLKKTFINSYEKYLQTKMTNTGYNKALKRRKNFEIFSFQIEKKQTKVFT